MPPGRNSWREDRPYNLHTGKGPKANRMTQWPVAAEKYGNALEQRGHAEFDCFDRKVRQGGMTKPSINLQELRRRIYRKAKAANRHTAS